MKPTEDDKEFLLKTGKLIAAKRTLLRMKETDLAKDARISQAAMSGIENGSYEGFKITILNRLLAILKIDWSELPPPPLNISKYFICSYKYQPC